MELHIVCYCGSHIYSMNNGVTIKKWLIKTLFDLIKLENLYKKGGFPFSLIASYFPSEIRCHGFWKTAIAGCASAAFWCMDIINHNALPLDKWFFVENNAFLSYLHWRTKVFHRFGRYDGIVEVVLRYFCTCIFAQNSKRFYRLKSRSARVELFSFLHSASGDSPVRLG